MKKRKLPSVLLLLLLLLLILLTAATLISCDEASDGEAPDTAPYINVYVPYRDVLVTVRYDETRGQLKSLAETLNTALTMAGHTVTNEEFLGVYDMAEGGNIIYNTEGMLHGDYQFESGITLFAQFRTAEAAPTARTKSLVFNEWEKSSVNHGVFRRMTVTEGEKVTCFSPVTFTPGGDFAGWEEAESGRLVTDRDGKLLPDYDIWASEETEFYPRVVAGTVNRCYLHLEGGVVTFEYSSNLNAADVLPKDERDGRGIIGWSTDPKAKYPADIKIPTYLGSQKAYLYVKEGTHYYPIYSEYKDVSFVYGDQVEVQRKYRYYPEGNVWGDQLLWEIAETEKIYLPASYYATNKGITYIRAYKTESGKVLPVGAIPYEDAESVYYGTEETKVVTATLRFNDGESVTEYGYTIANAIITLPDGKGEGFLGWYMNKNGAGGKVLSLRSDEYGAIYVTCEDGEIRYSSNSYTFYARYSEGGDGQ